MRHFDFEDDEEDDDDDDTPEGEVNNFFADTSPSDADMTALRLINEPVADYDLLFASIGIAEKSFTWRFFSPERKLATIAKIYAGLREIAE
jgi:hypothetical protein